jgi:integrase
MPKAKERDGVFQRKDRSGWWVSYVDASGKRKKEKVTAYTRTQAMTALSAIKTRIERDSILGVKSASEITTADLLKRFKAYQKAHLRPTTFVRLDGILETLKAALPVQAKEITRRTVADYIMKRSETVSAGTVAKEFATLNHALRLAVEWELLTVNPAQGAKLPRQSEGRTRYLSPTEFKAALEAAPDWTRGPMALAAFTGMRRGEILGLCWKDVDLDGQRVYLPDTKNGTLRVLTLNQLATQVFKSLPVGEPGTLVFLDVDAAKLSTYTKRVFASVGIMDASFHSLRHTAASWLVMEGVDLYTVGKILGHKTPRMTQRYAHLSPGYLATAVNKLDGVFAGALPEP